MLIKVKNPDLYDAWIAYYEAFHKDWMPAMIRTQAFFDSQRGEMPPCDCR